MTKPADLLKRQIVVNKNNIDELMLNNSTLRSHIVENMETITILEAANNELKIAISKLEENV